MVFFVDGQHYRNDQETNASSEIWSVSKELKELKELEEQLWNILTLVGQARRNIETRCLPGPMHMRQY